jgi:small subunit ribosomal protein S2
MARLPGAVVVVDARKEYLALREAAKLGISTIGVIDTDSDPDSVEVAIPANDDSIRAVDIILNELADAVAVGKTMVGAKPAEAPARPRRSRSRRAVLARADESEPEPEPVAVTEETSQASDADSEAPEPKPEQSDSEADKQAEA